MRFVGIRRAFSTLNEEQYTTIGEFRDEMSRIYGVENLMGLGCNWTENAIEYDAGNNWGNINERTAKA